jgi:branched-subunit amino acid ABC-type transport system permease component
VTTLLPFVVVGLVTGSLYGLAGVGLVLTYKTSGVFNFAHGAVATVGAYSFYVLHVQHGVPWVIALVLCVIGLGAVLGFALERLARSLARVSPALQVVATVGLLLVVQSLAVILFGAAQRNVPPYLPTGLISVGGVNIGLDQLVTMLVALVSAGGLFVFFRATTLGLSMRAVVDDPDLLATSGTSAVRVRQVAWIVGAAFACLSGVLVVPTTGLDASILTLLVVQAFGAAAVGLFSSLPLTYVGGLLIGVIASISTKYVGQVSWLAGLPSAAPFLVLFTVLVLAPRRRLVDVGSQLRLRVTAPPAGSSRTRTIGGVVALAGLAIVPQLVGARLAVWTSGLVLAIVFLSLHLLVRTSGQVSLAHASFAAVGAAGFAHLLSAGLPWAMALVGAGLITVPVGAIIAIPAIRLSGLYLAVATFGFGILLERLVFPTGLMFGANGALDTPRPPGFAGDRAYYYVVLTVAVAAAVVATAVIRGRLGRLLLAMSDSPTALSTLGTEVNVVRILVFCLSALMVGVAGALLGGVTQSINGTAFSFFTSLQWLAVLAISGAPFRYRPVPTALLAGASMAVIPSYLDSATLQQYLPALFGLAALLNALGANRAPRRQAAPDSTASRAVGRRPGPVAARMQVTPS